MSKTSLMPALGSTLNVITITLDGSAVEGFAVACPNCKRSLFIGSGKDDSDAVLHDDPPCAWILRVMQVFGGKNMGYRDIAIGGDKVNSWWVNTPTDTSSE